MIGTTGRVVRKSPLLLEGSTSDADLLLWLLTRVGYVVIIGVGVVELTDFGFGRFG